MPERLSMADAERLVDAAIEESRRRGVATAIAVVDAQGASLMLARCDGARSYYPDVACGKAMAAALWQTDSRSIGREAGSASIQARVNQLYGGRVVFAPGGVVLRRGETVVGALGVGGSGPDSDEEIARLAASLLGPGDG